MYLIYIHYNRENGKMYIGQTKQDTYTRWGKDGHRYLEKKPSGEYVHPKFARAIIKYGWDAFDHFIVFENLTKEQADAIEKELILQTKSNTDEGYNITEGGDGSCGTKWSEAQREAFHKARIGHPPVQSSIDTIKKTQGKPCKIVELNLEFCCSGDCADYLGVTKGAVKSALKRNNGTCKNYHLVYV